MCRETKFQLFWLGDDKDIEVRRTVYHVCFRSPIMQGNSEQHQLTLISQLCGSISPEVWHGVDQLELYTKMELPKGQKRKVKERLKYYVRDAYACDLIDKLLWLDPSKRIDSDGALDHEFLWTDPLPCSLVSCKLFVKKVTRKRMVSG